MRCRCAKLLLDKTQWHDTTLIVFDRHLAHWGGGHLIVVFLNLCNAVHWYQLTARWVGHQALQIRNCA